jgi:hypothetical protein
MGEATSHEFGNDQASLYCFAKAHSVSQEQSNAAAADCSQYWNKLVRLELKAARLSGKQCGGPERLLEKKRLMVNEPVC